MIAVLTWLLQYRAVEHLIDSYAVIRITSGDQPILRIHMRALDNTCDIAVHEYRRILTLSCVVVGLLMMVTGSLADLVGGIKLFLFAIGALMSTIGAVYLSEYKVCLGQLGVIAFRNHVCSLIVAKLRKLSMHSSNPNYLLDKYKVDGVVLYDGVDPNGPCYEQYRV